jgi:putative ABC transport system ATP-binding protein
VGSNTAILVQDLVKVYRLGGVEVQALRGLNLTVSEGEIVSIIGPSGSGKSTLLNIIGGIDRATAGYVKVMGVDLTSLNQSQLIEFRRRQVGYLFQNMNLIPTLNAAENIDLPLAARGVDKKTRKARVVELLELVGLENRSNHRPHQLSGGEQQRVALATALSNDPPMILVDEPTADLDTENAKIIVDYLVKTGKSQAKTVVMATHDPRVARAGERILRIGDGVIVEDVESIESLHGVEDYESFIRMRVAEVKRDEASLESEFKSGHVSSDVFAKRHRVLSDNLEVLEAEIQRLGSLMTK